MNTILSNLLVSFELVYLDDILMYSTSDDKHKHHLRFVFECLHKHVLYAKLSKCDFSVREIDYLGHIIGGEQVHADPTQISTVKD